MEAEMVKLLSADAQARAVAEALLRDDNQTMEAYTKQQVQFN